MEEDLARRGLTRARATLLAYLRDQGPTIQSELARALRVSARNVTGLVNGLEASGLVRRSPHPTDGRAALVELTDDGARAAAALARDEREFAQYLLADCTTDELDTLAVALDQLLACLSDPEYSTLRRSALRRWPLATKTGRAPQSSAVSHGETPTLVCQAQPQRRPVGRGRGDSEKVLRPERMAFGPRRGQQPAEAAAPGSG